jgi:hypothetical protein
MIEFPAKGTFFSSAGRWVSQPKTKICLAAARWCASKGGQVAYFTARNHCNLPKRAHQLASAYKKLTLCGFFARIFTDVLCHY